MRSYRRLISAAFVCLLGAGPAMAACTKHDPGPDPVAKAFLAGWSAGDLSKVAFVDPTGATVTPVSVQTSMKDLAGDLAGVPVKVAESGAATVKKDDATVTADVDWTVSPGVVWHYQTTVPLRRTDGAWRVVWQPSVLHPKLIEGAKLTVQRLAAPRAGILDGKGRPLVEPRPVVVVGVQPRYVTDAQALAKALDAAFRSIHIDIDVSNLPDQIKRADKDAFVEVVTLRKDDYLKIRGLIHDLPGTVFREKTMQLAPDHDFARALIGTVGDVRKDQMDAHPGRYQVGDQVGQGGLEEEYDLQLRGKSGVSVSMKPPAGDGGDQPDAVELFRTEPVAGQPLKTTLDPAIQQAADAVLTKQPHRSALVAVRVSDGALLAVANGPGGGSLDLALTAQVPPGSTFKVITALGVLDNGSVTPDTIVNCPKTYTVQGRSFKNSNNFVLGQVPLHVDFAQSCNTAFASLAPKLGSDGLAKAAAQLGIGIPWQLGTAAFSGSVGTDQSPVQAAAAAFGQGTTLVSPVAMAGAAAAVARGGWVQPTLFTTMPAAPTGGSASPAPTASATTAAPTKLKPSSVTALRSMMREVVTGGTARDLAGVPGPPVHAKTGTAEYDNNPDHTHAWVMGYQGDIAFAVFVDNGGGSGATAVPMAAQFLRAIR